MVLVTIMTAMMVFMVTLVATYMNLGMRADFLSHWVEAYFVSWPVAATTGFLVMPMAQRATAGIMRRIAG